MRIFSLLLVASVAALLPGCATPPRPTWAEPGVAVVGRIVKSERADIWEGDMPIEGRVFWLETGPPKEIIAFGSVANCPPEDAGDDRYVVMLVNKKMGYSFAGPATSEHVAPWAYAIACARLDPTMSNFPNWRPQP